jgi:hypothetical protein
MGILLVYDVTDEKSFNSAFGFFTPLPLPIKLNPIFIQPLPPDLAGSDQGTALSFYP